MKAIVYERFGPPEVLNLKDVSKPVPKKNEVLIKVHASTVTIEDPRMRSAEFDWPLVTKLIAGLFIGFKKPRKQILGFEFAGTIESTGPRVTRFTPGAHVYGYTGMGLGAHAQYKCLPENGIIAPKPVNMTFEESAAVPNGALTSLVYLRNKACIKAGDRVLIIGASGAVGTAAIQLAKYFEANVTGVCSGANLKLIKSIGADTAIDYMKEDFIKNGQQYDIIFDAVSKSTFEKCQNSLTENGRYLRTVFGLREMIQMILTRRKSGKKIIVAASNFSWKYQDLIFLKKIVEVGKYKSIIDRVFPLEQTANAHRYVELGHKKGNVVIQVSSE